METKANFVLIGAFTLAGLAGIVALLLWFARVELDQTFDYYDVRFTSVSGLSEASDVRFSGLPVGQVVDVRLSPDRDGTISVRIEVDAATPVRTDSVATIESQGVTGVSFVLIGPGTASAPLVDANDRAPFTEITAGRSVFQTLSEDAPELISETLNVVEEVGVLFGDENQERFQQILINAETASETVAQTLADFSDAAKSVTEFSQQVDDFNAILAQVSDDLERLMQTADTTLASVNDLTQDAGTFLNTGTDTLNLAQGTFTQAERYIAEDLTATTEALQVTVTELRTEIASLTTQAQTVMETFNVTGATATQRLSEGEATLAAANDLIARMSGAVESVDGSFTRFDRLLETEGAPLLAETRVAIAEATGAISVIADAAETDLPMIVARIREAADTATLTITQVSEDLTAASGRIDGLSVTAQTALTQVTQTFADANLTLDAINLAMETGTETLEVAERAFEGADRVINEDIDGIVTGLETSLASLNIAIGRVSDDIPAITSELREASRAAESAFATLQRIISAAGPSVAEFTNTGLPLYTRLADESRGLIRNLDRLTQQIQRDPARFFLNQQSPEFQR